jgi:hypothetical protein
VARNLEREISGLVTVVIVVRLEVVDIDHQEVIG